MNYSNSPPTGALRRDPKKSTSASTPINPDVEKSTSVSYCFAGLVPVIR